MHIILQCLCLVQRILRPIGFLSEGSYMPPHPRTDKPLCIKPRSRYKLQLDTQSSCSCSELAGADSVPVGTVRGSRMPWWSSSQP